MHVVADGVCVGCGFCLTVCVGAVWVALGITLCPACELCWSNLVGPTTFCFCCCCVVVVVWSWRRGVVMLRRNPNGEDNVRAFVDLGTCWGRAGLGWWQ